MPDYRRAAIPGGTYFFTLVTNRRQQILCNENIRTALHDAIATTRAKSPFTIDAMVLMPDHLHAIWTLPENDHAYSVRWSMIKRLVTQAVGAPGTPYGFSREEVAGAHGAPYGGSQLEGRVRRAHQDHSNRIRGVDGGCSPPASASRLKRREGLIWQRRFWEHRVRDQADLNRCIDYLHWNPVKHGYVSRVADWPFSTFHRFVRNGIYPEDWGGEGVVVDGAFGE